MWGRDTTGNEKKCTTPHWSRKLSVPCQNTIRVVEQESAVGYCGGQYSFGRDPAVPASIPHGLTRNHVLLALAELDAGARHTFGEPTKYELVHAGKRFAPKAVIGLAHRHLTGTVLSPDQFSGGEAPGQANFVLRQLGFTVVLKGEPVPEDEKEPRRNWSEAEVAATVSDYFEMLRKEMLGEHLNKKAHREQLKTQLDRRSDPSVEYKHQNISAILIGLALPYIRGYKPAGNYQALLAQGVDHFLAQNPTFFDGLATAPSVNPTALPTTTFVDPDSLFEPPPENIVLPQTGKPWETRRNPTESTSAVGTPKIGNLAASARSSWSSSSGRDSAERAGTTWPGGWIGSPVGSGMAWGSTSCRSTRTRGTSGWSR